MPTVKSPRADQGAPPNVPDLEPQVRPDDSHARSVRPGFVAKLVLMGIVDAVGVYCLLAAWNASAWGIFGGMLALLAAANWVYFTRRAIPLKYILPGLAFLLVFQVFVVVYTGFVAFSNYGDGHNGTKQQAVDALLVQDEKRVEGSASYPLTVVAQGPTLGFAVVDPDGASLVGTAEDPLSADSSATIDDGRISAVDGWTVLSRQEILAQQEAITTLRVPISDQAADGSIRTQDARVGYVFKSVLTYDDATGAMTNTETGVVYTPNAHGQFEAPDGTVLPTGWRVSVGFENFKTAFSDTRYAKPFFQILVWTFAFAILSVVTTFLLGLFLAMVFNDVRMRGRKVYRMLMILPYAIPGFVAALLWSGMFNRRFGFINNTLFGGAEIPWLTDPTLAKFSVLFVNLWLGFPYMFLICTGALQSLPGDVLEAAKIDGASKLRTWKSVIMPLLLVSTAPLLISSFAFNFNNFTLIYMLTGGGPQFEDASVPLGHTDILISMVYSISGIDGGAPKNYGLTSALSIVIFVIVGGISAIAFRQTRKLEELS